MSTLDQFLNHPIETLERALHIRRQIDQLNEALKELFGPTPISMAALNIMQPKRRGRRKMSAAARAKIAAAQRARWAKSKISHGPLTAVAIPAPKPKKGGMSAAGRARIAAAQKKRWAKVKAQKSSRLLQNQDAKRSVS
jgi:hypothetical protein